MSHSMVGSERNLPRNIYNNLYRWGNFIGSYAYAVYHLFTETEGNSVFCGLETAVIKCQSVNKFTGLTAEQYHAWND